MSFLRRSLAWLLLTPSLLTAGEPRPLPAGFTAPALVARSGLGDGYRLPANVRLTGDSTALLDLRPDGRVGFLYADAASFPAKRSFGVWRGDAADGGTVLALSRTFDDPPVRDVATRSDDLWLLSVDVIDPGAVLRRTALFALDLAAQPPDAQPVLDASAGLFERAGLQIDERGVAAYQALILPPGPPLPGVTGWASVRDQEETLHWTNLVIPAEPAARPEGGFGRPEFLGVPALVPARGGSNAVWLAGTASWSDDAQRTARASDAGEIVVLVENATADPTSPYASLSSRVAAGASGDITFVAQRTDGAFALLRVDWNGAITPLADDTDPQIGALSLFTLSAVNVDGWTAFVAGEGGFPLGTVPAALYVDDGTTRVRVAQDGDLVSTDRGPARICRGDDFTPAFPGPVAINDAGAIAFVARLCPAASNPSEIGPALGFGVFVAEPLPAAARAKR
ncbi:MAG: hypothetical protein AAF772_17545 [Acidobacteriota bacterium]